MDAPKPGDVIYVDTELYLSHGVDDFRGGKATVSQVKDEMLGGRAVPFVEVAENPGSFYNWEYLAEKQPALAAEFGDARAHPIPDYRPEFNELGIPRVAGPPAPANGPEWEPAAVARTRRPVYVLWLVALLVFVLDRWSKTLILHSFLPGESRLVIPHLLWWTYVQNVHGAFGLFGNSPILLIVLALLVLGVFAYAFRDAVRHSNLVRVAFGMIVGGAIGNIVDRFQHQWVVDFIDFRTIWPDVFNVADSCITVGVALLVLASLRRERRA
jgi:signal peptidase II